MDALCQKTSRLIQEVQHHDLMQYERHRREEDMYAADSSLQSKLDQIREHVSRLEILAGKEPPSQRQAAKYRVSQYQYDLRHLVAARDQLRARQTQREMADQQREELLTRRFVANDQTATSIAMEEYMMQENDKLHATGKSLDDFIASGQQALQSLKEQGQGMAGVRRKLVDIASTLGMSNTVMRLVEKRAVQDRIIMGVGMVLFCIFMYIIVKFFT